MLRRIVFCSIVLSAGVAAFSQTETVKFDASVQGKPAGGGYQTRTMLAGGGFQLRTVLNIKQGQQNIALDLTTTIDSKGVDTRKLTKITARGHTVTITTQLSDKGATVTAADGKTKTIPLLTKTTRTDPSNLWFLKTHPKPGATATYQSFEPFELRWSDSTITYVGDRTITVGGKHVKAHFLTHLRDGKTSNIYVDSRALPLRIEEPSLTLTRKG